MSDYQPDESTAQVDLLRFLSACYHEPAAEFSEERLFDSVALATRQAYPELAGLADRLKEAFAAESLQTLLVDYTRLFLGPMKALASPYSTSWLPTPAVNDEVLPSAVLAFYGEAGFDVDGELAELPDHLAIELEFLYVLTFNIQQANLVGNIQDAEATVALRTRFLAEHLRAWLVPFTAAIKENADTDFYRVLAELTEEIVVKRLA